jgi:hypothetical protein
MANGRISTVYLWKVFQVRFTADVRHDIRDNERHERKLVLEEVTPKMNEYDAEARNTNIVCMDVHWLTAHETNGQLTKSVEKDCV